MILAITFLLGMTLGTAGLFAKQITTQHGNGFSNQKVQFYFTILGKLSNLVIPITAVGLIILCDGIVTGLVAIPLLLAGAIAAGMIRPSYQVKLLTSLLGIPFVATLFLVLLGI